MKPTNDLHELILSLSSSEKRNFKKHAFRRGGEAFNYCRLFDEIASQTEYDESLLREKFKDESFVRNFAVAKKYLYDSLLASLRSYYHHASKEAAIHAMYDSAWLLGEKGLVKQAQKILKKARKMALKYEKELFLYQSLQQEMELLITEADADALEEFELKQLPKFDSALENLQNKLDYSRLYFKMRLIQKKMKNGLSTAEKLEITKLAESPLLHDENIALTYQSKIHFFDFFITYYALSKDPKNQVLYERKRYKLLASYPAQNPLAVLKALHSLCLTAMSSNEIQSLHFAMTELQALNQTMPKTLNTGHKALFFDKSTHLEFLLMKYLGDFKQGVLQSGRIEKSLKQFGNSIPMESRISIFSDMAICYFAEGSIQKALNWINRSINLSFEESEKPHWNFLMLFKMVLHFEQRSLRKIHSLFPKVIAAVRHLPELQKVELEIVRFMKMLNKARDKFQEVEAFLFLQKTLKEILNVPGIDSVLARFDFSAWATSKIKNRSFKETILEERKL